VLKTRPCRASRRQGRFFYGFANAISILWVYTRDSFGRSVTGQKRNRFIKADKTGHNLKTGSNFRDVAAAI